MSPWTWALGSGAGVGLLGVIYGLWQKVKATAYRRDADVSKLRLDALDKRCSELTAHALSSAEDARRLGDVVVQLRAEVRRHVDELEKCGDTPGARAVVLDTLRGLGLPTLAAVTGEAGDGRK